eukprot:scaffold33832_cov101-Isochrysis_galbana.AAC.2
MGGGAVAELRIARTQLRLQRDGLSRPVQLQSRPCGSSSSAERSDRAQAQPRMRASTTEREAGEDQRGRRSRSRRWSRKASQAATPPSAAAATTRPEAIGRRRYLWSEREFRRPEIDRCFHGGSSRPRG